MKEDNYEQVSFLIRGYAMKASRGHWVGLAALSRISVLAILIVGLSAQAGSRPVHETARVMPTSFQTDSSSTSTLKVSLVRIDVVVLAQAEPVAGLTHNDFTILENGIPKPIFSINSRQQPLSLMIALDPESAKTALDGLNLMLTNSIQPGDEVGIIGLFDEPTMLQDYTNEPLLLTSAISLARRLSLSPTLPLGTRIKKALSFCERTGRIHSSEARNVWLVVSQTPSGQTGQKSTLEATLTDMAKSNIALCWNSPEEPNTNDLRDVPQAKVPLSFADIVHLTGGELVGIDSSSLMKRIRTVYRITYIPNTKGREGQPVRIKIGLKPTTNHFQENATLNYQRMVFIPNSR